MIVTKNYDDDNDKHVADDGEHSYDIDDNTDGGY